MSANSLVEDALYEQQATHGIWAATVIDYFHTLLFAVMMVGALYRKFTPEGCPTSIWLVLIRLLDSLLFCMSNLPGISRILYILTIRMTAAYLLQVFIIYTLYNVVLATLIGCGIINRSNAVHYMVCQTAASIYIMLRLALVLRRVVRRPRVIERLRIRYLDSEELNETVTMM